VTTPQPLDTLLAEDRSLRRLARRLLSDAHAAEDLAQETWLAACSHRAGLTTPSAWLTTVARNLAAKLRRGDERRARRERDSARSEPEPSAGEILEREAARARVVAAVLALEEPYRATVLLRYFEDLPPRAIARRQGLAVETVRTRLKRALEALRARLERDLDGRGAWCTPLLPFARGPRGSLLAPPLIPFITAVVMSTQAKLAGAAVAASLLVLFAVRQRGVAELAPGGRTSAVAPAELQVPPEEPAALARALPERTEASASLAESSSEPQPAAEHGSLRVTLAWSDGSPAEGIHARVETAWSSGTSWRARPAVTGGDGSFVLERLPPGLAHVQLDRVDGYTAEIEAGKEARIEARLEAGFDARGVVLDPLGSPVGAAEIWLSHRHTVEEGMVVARTGADGRFELRGCSGGALNARAPRFAPSLVQQLQASEGSALELELVLMGPGGELTGRVVDREGAHVPSAFVYVEPLGFNRRVVAVPVGGTREVSGLRPSAQDARTDGNGRFAVRGLEPGLRKVAIQAPGHSLWRGEAEVFAHGSTTLDVRLLAGVDVEGQVTDPQGRPRRAEVRSEIDEDPVDLIFYSATETDAEGRFRLEDLGPDEFELVAEAREGRVRARLRGRPSETIEWNPVIGAGGVIRGVLVDERGSGLAGHYVLCEDEAPWPSDPCGSVSSARTDAEGRFELVGLGDHPHRLEAHSEGEVLFPLAVAGGVLTDEGEVRLQVTLENRPSAWIAGTVVDASGAPVPNAQVRAASPGSRRRSRVLTDADGHFELGPHPPGAWSLEVCRPAGDAQPPTILGPRTLGAGETWDCGEVVLGR
jgi:RNA polymerase sigma-70 factor (ECF subfamily)